jgi:hypothetical protein
MIPNEKRRSTVPISSRKLIIKNIKIFNDSFHIELKGKTYKDYVKMKKLLPLNLK